LTKPVSLKEFNQTLSKWLNPSLSFESMADAPDFETADSIAKRFG
jgi:hypothetical protein